MNKGLVRIILILIHSDIFKRIDYNLPKKLLKKEYPLYEFKFNKTTYGVYSYKKNELRILDDNSWIISSWLVITENILKHLLLQIEKSIDSKDRFFNDFHHIGINKHLMEG